METDKQRYRVFSAQPQWVFELAELPPVGKCAMRSLPVKTLERRADGVIVPHSPVPPLSSSNDGREDAFLDQGSADRHSITKIDRENVDGHLSDLRLADQIRAVPRKVVAPAVASRIEQSHVASVQIAGDIGPLVRVATFATQGEVIGNRCPTVFLGDDVIDLKGEQSHICGELAVFATRFRAKPNQFLKRRVHAKPTKPIRHASTTDAPWIASIPAEP